MKLASLPLVPRGGRGRSVVFLVFLGTVADVPMVMQPVFQQFSEFLVPQFQFLVTVLDIPVMPHRRIRCAVLWVGCYAPVVAQRQVLWWSSFLCFSYFRNAWYDRGYMYCVSYGGFLDDFPTSFCEGGFRPCGLPGLLSVSLCNDRWLRTLSVRSCRPRRRQRWDGWFCWLRCTSRCVGISRCIQFVCRQAQDLLHHGPYGQVALHLPVELPQVQFLDKVMMFSLLAPLRRLPGRDERLLHLSWW